MDYGLLFRKRIGASKHFLSLVLEKTRYSKYENAIDMLRSYMIALVATKFTCNPLEMGEILSQLSLRTSKTKIRGLLISYLFHPQKKRLLLSGLGVDLVSLLPNIFIENYFFESFELLGYQGNKNLHHLMPHLAKLLSTFCTYPMEVYKSRIVASNFSDILHFTSNPQTVTLKSCMQDVYLKLDAGVLPTFVKVILYCYIRNLIYKQMKHIGARRIQSVHDHNKHRPGAQLYSENDEEDFAELQLETSFSNKLMLDYVSGLLGEMTLYPLSVVIRNLQTKSPLSQQSQGSFVQTVKSLWKTEGIRGFYKGFLCHTWNALSVYFVTMIFFALSRSMFTYMNRITYKKKDEEQNKEEEGDK